MRRRDLGWKRAVVPVCVVCEPGATAGDGAGPESVAGRRRCCRVDRPLGFGLRLECSILAGATAPSRRPMAAPSCARLQFRDSRRPTSRRRPADAHRSSAASGDLPGIARVLTIFVIVVVAVAFAHRLRDRQCAPPRRDACRRNPFPCPSAIAETATPHDAGCAAPRRGRRPFDRRARARASAATRPRLHALRQPLLNRGRDDRAAARVRRSTGSSSSPTSRHRARRLRATGSSSSTSRTTRRRRCSAPARPTT